MWTGDGGGKHSIEIHLLRDIDLHIDVLLDEALQGNNTPVILTPDKTNLLHLEATSSLACISNNGNISKDIHVSHLRMKHPHRLLTVTSSQLPESTCSNTQYDFSSMHVYAAAPLVKQERGVEIHVRTVCARFFQFLPCLSAIIQSNAHGLCMENLPWCTVMPNDEEKIILTLRTQTLRDNTTSETEWRGPFRV